ncbi:MAG: heavy metal translocating P-type ATPase, partial [Clostridia bacterium]|nr:heavy metal translocating P-type ATPase [Clostridia bacterium]
QYLITGMSCAACSARVEKAVNGVEGVTACSVNLLTNSMTVEGADPALVIQAVEQAGYGARLKGEKQTQTQEVKPKNGLLGRLISSLVVLSLLMYLSMGHVMWGAPLPNAFAQSPLALALTQLLLSAVVLVINQRFFVSGTKGLLHRAPNMDTLVALGSGASFLYSTAVVYQMILKPDHAAHLLHNLYFESAAMILTLITLGKLLESYSKGKTTNALQRLIGLSPKTATILQNQQEVLVPVDQVVVGQEFVVRPGEKIPVDGLVLEGISAIDESSLTGESIPKDVTEGNSVSAATINQSGFLRCKATRVGQDTTLAQIIQMVSDAAASKAPIAKIADKVSGVFVPVVMGIALITFVVWLMIGQPIGEALTRAISVLVISCPCALGLATPVAIMVGSGLGAKYGLLFKTATALEQTGKIQIVALDKTGTITKGQPYVTDLLPANGITTDELLAIAFDLEKNSEHPLARAIVDYGSEGGLTPNGVEEFTALAGEGVTATRNGQLLFGGNLGLAQRHHTLDESQINQLQALSNQGKTPLLFGTDEQFYGIITVADVVKEDSSDAVIALHNMGIETVMLTGDNEQTATAVAKTVGINRVIANLMPTQKETAIRELQTKGFVAMVGDGINDAPALTRADMGIAIGAGTDVAIDAADVVLIHSTLADLPAAIRLSRGVLRNIKQNLFWAFFYNMIGIPLAAGAFISLLGWEMNPMFGAAAMSLSSVCVVTNAMRLNWLNPHKSNHDHTVKQQRKKEQNMTKTMKIEGMMCPHCSGRIKTVLEAVDGVKEAQVDHSTDSAIVTLEKEVANDLLKELVEKEGYKVIEIA